MARFMNSLSYVRIFPLRNLSCLFSCITSFYPKFYFCLLWIQLPALFGLVLTQNIFSSPLFSTFLCRFGAIYKYSWTYFVFQKTQRALRSLSNKSSLRLRDKKNCPQNEVLQILKTTWTSIGITETKLVPFFICPSRLGSFWNLKLLAFPPPPLSFRKILDNSPRTLSPKDHFPNRKAIMVKQPSTPFGECYV